MKRSALILMITVFGLWVGVGVAQEATPEQTPQGQHERGGHRGMDPQARVQHLTKKLNLSSDQQSKVLTILQDQQKQMESLRSDTSVAQQDRRSKMMDLHKSTDEQIRAVLNPDQQTKFDKMAQKEEARMGKHHGDSNQNQPAPPQQ